MIELANSIENLYMTFNAYNTEGMHYCDCGCIDEDDVKKLHSKPLHELELEDISSYHGSALYTWGDLEHYKHFLPRFFELYTTNRKMALIDLYDIGRKLEYAKWTEWPDNEVKAIRDFVMTDWIDFVNNSTSEINDFSLENYSRFFDISVLLHKWDFQYSNNGLKNFVIFFYYHGNRILNSGSHTNAKYSDKIVLQLILENNLSEILYKEFYKYEESDEEYTGKVSIVLQMIDQFLKVINP